MVDDDPFLVKIGLCGIFTPEEALTLNLIFGFAESPGPLDSAL